MTVELIEIGPLDRRRRCECCRYPTLGAPDEYEPDPEWELSRTSCDLCEWENAPLDSNGDVRADAPSQEELNDGLSLDAARANLVRFRSIYDPDDPPAWKVAPPSVDVVEAREALRAAYEEVLGLELPDRYERSGYVRACEDVLYDALAAQRRRDESFDDRAT